MTNVVYASVEIAGQEYGVHVVALECATDLLAKRAFETALRWAEENPGRGVGVLRTKRAPEGGTTVSIEDHVTDWALVVMAQDLPTLAQYVRLISKAAPVVERRVVQSFADAVLRRRLDRAVAHLPEFQQAGSGGILDVVRRHDDKGGRIQHDGSVIEP
jgi:hypothetical protein